MAALLALVLALPCFSWAQFADETGAAVPAGGFVGGGVERVVPAGSLYVRCGLTTGSNDGSSHENAFQDWTAARTASKAVSQDMYFLSGTTCDVGSSPMSAWSGTQSDRAVLGAYYIDSGDVERVGVEGGFTPGTDPDNKPVLQSTFTEAACSVANSCPLIGLGYVGLIDIQNTDDFTVQQVSIQNWGGRGVDTDGATASPGNRRIIVDGVTVKHVARAAIIGKDTHEWLAFYDNTAINAAMCTRYSYTGCEVRPGSVVFGFNQGRADRGQYAVNIMEGNYVTSAKAEGIGAYGAENVLIRGNILVATWSSTLYVDGSHNVVVENNIVNGDINETQAPLSREVTALAGGYEAFLGNRRDITHTWRNNLSVSQSGYCFGSSNEDTDTRQTRYYYGNTCAYGKGYSNFTFWPNNDIDLVRSRSNVFYSPGNNNCLGHGSNSDFDYNVWDSQPSDADCRGSNDVYDDPDFADDAQMQATGPVNGDGTGGTIVTDFTPAYLNAGSPASGAGDPAGETALCDIDADTLPFDLIRYNVPDKANWEKCLYYDALGNVRDSTAPDAGAVEQGA